MNKEAILSKYTQNYIYKYYPINKQKSDQVDWMYWTTYLVTHTNVTIDEIGKVIYKASANIIDNKSTFEEEVNNLEKQYGKKQAWEQLLKVGLRVGWVQQIKNIYYEILNDDSITADKLYFAIKRYIPLDKLFNPNK